MALKKSELYSSLWSSCDELRGSMDASQYKDYVLVLLFVKYVSDKYAGVPYAPITIPDGASFQDMVALKGKPDIGDQINKKILGPLANANKLSDMPDFNDSTKLGDGKAKVECLTNLITIFENPALDFSKNRADGDDILGDAYEYLMRHFATESGKSKGQFYTPAEVSRIMAQIVGIRDASTTNATTVYDLTCGSGSLLLKVGDAASAKVTLYGQEKDAATAGLARMNMILHNNPTALIKQGNTLANPLFTGEDGRLKTFDYVVANPPFSDKSWSNGVDVQHDPHERFQHFGTPPSKQGDYAYLLHIVRSLKSTGKGACILPHGVLFRGNAEAVIRKNLLQRGYIKAIIGLPANLFYGTGIPACIIVVDKEHATARKGIFMIDASQGFVKDGNKNRLRDQDIHKIVDAFSRLAEIKKFSRMVPLSEISDPKNDFNLNLPRYIDSTEPEDRQNIDAHLRGGIPIGDIDDMAKYWDVFPDVRKALFEPAAHEPQGASRGLSAMQNQNQRLAPSRSQGYCQLRVPAADIKAAIFGHAEFTTFNESVTAIFAKWKQASTPLLKAIAVGGKPKALIETLSESLLEVFQKDQTARLVDPYDVYQHLMTYWSETMQDDVYLIVGDGWQAAAKLRPIVTDKDSKTKEKPDFTLGKQKFKAELIPPALVIARYFQAEQSALESLEAEAAALAQKLEELQEEHSGEEGLLEEAKTDAGKITKASISARLREIRSDGSVRSDRSIASDRSDRSVRSDEEQEDQDEQATLESYLALIDQEAAASAKIKAAQSALITKVAAQYGKLTEAEIKTLVVDDKWLARLAADVQSELDRVSQSLTGRVRQLAERYASPLPSLTEQVESLSARVAEHLKKMGAVWN